ncbi:MAG: hypothetical protein KatS3mg052_2734 [Candidatus Roseilinea sp.]|nr:MAG: hypothetical protein KatS3mg052_2734 [Candidatus Roseilinea sp.]
MGVETRRWVWVMSSVPLILPPLQKVAHISELHLAQIGLFDFV